MRVLVIPDIHLKTWIFDRAEQIIKDGKADRAVCPNTHKFHYPTCSSVDDMKAKNKKEYQGNREDLIKQGYEPCKRCNP